MALRSDPTEPTLRTTDPTHAVCDETRSTRLHYQLRCLLPVDHDGRHSWTPELVPMDDARATA
jgi:hypothetical protein